MSYTSYLQIINDINYMEEFDPEDKMSRFGHSYFEPEEFIDPRIVKRVKKIWLERVKEKYEASKNSKSAIGKFLAEYPLKFKEFCCLLDLVEESNDKGDLEHENGIKVTNDVFKKHKVRFRSSSLKRYKLVFKIVDPLRPMKTVYEVSYKAQLALKNKKYTDEYQQLDMALEEEAKRNSPDALESLYYIIEPKSGFSDLVAASALKEKLKAALSREQKKDLIFKKWGFNRVIEYGKGTTLNFRGPPGTGKTLSAHCLAKELGTKLLMVRYDQLQNCFIGVTEKHIQQIFSIAKVKNAVLFFDEADAIALNRASLEQSWEMSQVNTLLKELERFDGVCIFATNFSEKYDPAFERRLTMHIDFALPDNKQGIEILNKVLPKRSRDERMDLNSFNLENLSGGDIKNVALNAAGIAAKENSPKIMKNHLSEAITLVKGSKKICSKKDVSYIM
ncbi:MAG: ATP-binding protein [bacterium]|nr:ATP-binding protein [bacterium]